VRKAVQQAAALPQLLHVHYQKPPPTPFRREILLTLTTFQTGILDAATFIGFGIFVANMTGNVILLGAAIAHLYQHDVLPNIIAIIAFLAGGFVTGIYERATRQPAGDSRYFFASMTAIHCALYFTAASLMFTDIIPYDETSGLRLIIFALLALGQGSQIVLSKRAGLPEFTTAVITSTLADLFANANFAQVRGNGMRGQIRRTASVIALFVGSIIGAETFKYHGFSVALFVAGGISCVIIFGWSL
jgi:uncharacterized membrane protein YoaK (UPF0700 family)